MTIAETYNTKLVTVFNTGDKKTFEAMLESSLTDDTIIQDYTVNDTLFLMFIDGSIHTLSFDKDGDIFGGTMSAATALKIVANNLPRASGGH